MGLFGQKKKGVKNPSETKAKASRSARKAADKFDRIWREYAIGERTEENLRRWASQMAAAAEAAQGLDINYNSLAYVYDQLGDTENELKYRIRAVEAGGAGEQYKLASLYANPKRGCFDPEKAVYWYQKAMEQGEENAFRDLAWLYQYGDGTDAEPDWEKVDEVYVAAAEWKYFWAYSRAAMCFYEGRGTAQDYQKAYLYANKSRNSQDNEWLVGILKKDGLGTEQDIPGAVKVLEELVQKGYGKAEEALADARRLLEAQKRREEEQKRRKEEEKAQRRAEEKRLRLRRLEEARNANPEAAALLERGKAEHSEELVRRAADMGHPDACYLLALNGVSGGSFSGFEITYDGKALEFCIDYYNMYLKLGGEKSALIERGLAERLMEYADELKKDGLPYGTYLESAAHLGNLMAYYKRAFVELDLLKYKRKSTYSEANANLVHYEVAMEYLKEILLRREEALEIEMVGGFSLATEAEVLYDKLKEDRDDLQKRIDEFVEHGGRMTD